MPERRTLWLGGFAAIAILYVGLAIVGAVRWFSAVPYFDAWPGFIGFYLGVSRGGYSGWWVQYNEHRIILSRLFYWADIKWFHGLGIFPLVAIFVLTGLAAYQYYLWLREVVDERPPRLVVPVLALVILSWLFLWSQHENLVWGFETHFTLAYLLPLAGLYVLHRSTQDDAGSARFFVAACVLGFASLGALANGVLVLPLMALFAILTRQRLGRVATLAVLSVGGAGLYLWGYQTIPGHGSLLTALMTQPLATAKYVAAYLGSPVHFILQFDRIPKTEAFAALAGLVLIACALWYAIQTFRQPRPDSARLALLTFILYIVASALVTAGGRVVFGWEQAVSSRYTTLAIAAWAALLVLAAPAIEKHVRKRGTGVFWGFVALAVVMFPLQMSTLRPDYRQLFERNVAGLALEMGAHDDAQTNVLLPQPGPLWQIAEPAIAENLSVFGTKPLGGLRERIGSAHVTSRVTLYRGALETATPVPGTRFLRVGGWMIDSAGHPPATISIVDESGRLVGFALTGDPRKDLRARFTSNAYFAGFKGYVLADMAGKPVVFVTDNGAGQFSAVVAP